MLLSVFNFAVAVLLFHARSLQPNGLPSRHQADVSSCFPRLPCHSSPCPCLMLLSSVYMVCHGPVLHPIYSAVFFRQLFSFVFHAASSSTSSVLWWNDPVVRHCLTRHSLPWSSVFSVFNFAIVALLMYVRSLQPNGFLPPPMPLVSPTGPRAAVKRFTEPADSPKMR